MQHLIHRYMNQLLKLESASAQYELSIETEELERPDMFIVCVGL